MLNWYINCTHPLTHKKRGTSSLPTWNCCAVLFMFAAMVCVVIYVARVCSGKMVSFHENTNQKEGFISSTQPSKCTSIRQMPITSRGCFQYNVTAADEDAATTSVAQGHSHTTREALCKTLASRFGTDPMYISNPNDTTSGLPYCQVPAGLKYAESSYGVHSDHRHKYQVRPGDRLTVCPPQTPSRRCVYHTSNTKQTCKSVLSRFSPQSHVDSSSTSPDVTVAMIPPTCQVPSTSENPSDTPRPTEPRQCTPVTANTTSGRFLVCSTTKHDTVALDKPSSADIDGSSMAACKTQCEQTSSCRYFRYNGDSCTLYDQYYPLTNIGEHNSESTIYGCSSVAPITLPGIVGTPDSRAGAQPFAMEPLFDKIPCGSCPYLGSQEGDKCNGGAGYCLPPFQTNESRKNIVQVGESSEQCEHRIRKAIQHGGLKTFTLPSTHTNKDGSVDSKVTTVTEDEVVDCLCNGTCPHTNSNETDMKGHVPNG